MVDRDRVLARLDALDGYLAELRSVVPQRAEDYRSVATRRACERLLQVAVEAVIDVCALLVAGLRLGVPADQDDLFGKLADRGVLTTGTADMVRRMKGFRNLLVHEYARIDDAIVFQTASGRLDDFETFKREVLGFLRTL